MNDGDRRDDDTRPLGDELFDTPRTATPGADAHPTVPLSTEPPATEPLVGDPAAPEPLPTEPLRSGPPARDGETSVLDVPGPTTHEPPETVPHTLSSPGPTAGAVPPSGPAPVATSPTAHRPPGAPAEPTSPVRRGPRVSTIVWGFVIVAFGVVVLAAALGARVDLGLATIVVLAAAGLTLVIGSIVSGARRRRG
ncbi:hypothetical protein [Cellulosimicrobium protaetiae]|uniref:Uncharacterized protein n=1 Tax=Cellulosimicrobium protaetiae TaxID=2587808 RepID=A0A6M5UG28_9MICO|nr:hypothetical protein [Cellulosimicrobium protaetiae]QJW37506.1 hypothetical protein FIC82_016270 [Cellulosimicrobium protaetiae]